MTVSTIDPLSDPRWLELIEHHPDASIFHTPNWLQALKNAYGYEPVVYTTCGPGKDLTNGILFCRINSWLTGNRLVSLPFSDHCQPLVNDPDTYLAILGHLSEERKRIGLKYVEIRPVTSILQSELSDTGFGPSAEYAFHTIDISPEPDDLFAKFHRTCVRVKIGRADREGLTYREGTDSEFVSTFYDLLLLTRRRFQVPPPPIVWFRNLAECLGPMMSIRIASKDGVPVSAIVTAIYKDVCYYKYTGSNKDAASMGGTHALVWRSILHAKDHGATKLDFGRTDSDNATLLDYKDRWASTRSEISYFSNPAASGGQHGNSGKNRLAKSVFSRMPDGLLIKVGGMLYKHIG